MFSDANYLGGPRRAVGEFVDVAVDAAGRPHLSYADRANGDLKYAVEADGNWEGATGVRRRRRRRRQDLPTNAACSLP